MTDRPYLPGIVKATLVRLLVALPPAWWPLASRIVNTLWPGFRDA